MVSFVVLIVFSKLKIRNFMIASIVPHWSVLKFLFFPKTRSTCQPNRVPLVETNQRPDRVPLVKTSRRPDLVPLVEISQSKQYLENLAGGIGCPIMYHGNVKLLLKSPNRVFRSITVIYGLIPNSNELIAFGLAVDIPIMLL